MSGVRKASRPPHPAPVVFFLDGERLVLRERSTRWWMRVLACQPPGMWWQAVPMSLAGAGTQRVVDRLLDPDDALDLDDVERLAEEVVSAVLGLDVWAGSRLAAMAYSNWVFFDGWCAGRGFDPLQRPVGHVLSAVYAWRASLCDKRQDLSKLDSEVWAPPPMRTAAGRMRDQAPRDWSDERESAAFMSALEA